MNIFLNELALKLYSHEQLRRIFTKKLPAASRMLTFCFNCHVVFRGLTMLSAARKDGRGLLRVDEKEWVRINGLLF